MPASIPSRNGSTRRPAINGTVRNDPTPIPGISYRLPPEGAKLAKLDASVELPCAGIPLPVLDEDLDAVAGGDFPYDVVGRGLYQALRTNPDCLYADRYAIILKEAYPHYISELATHIVMLDRKDVDDPYLDRKVNYLKIFAYIEPENSRIPREIGMTLFDKGLRLSALRDTTVTLYRAETFLRRSLQLSPDDTDTCHQLGELCYILGKYRDAAACWRALLTQLSDEHREKLQERLAAVETGRVPRVPAVDYLQAIGVALELHQQGEDEEAGAILRDILDDDVFCGQFPLPQVHYVLGLSCTRLGMPRDAKEYLTEALRLDPAYEEARAALVNLTA